MKNTLYAYRGIYRRKHINLDKDAKIQVNADLTSWLGTDNIASATWEVEDSSSAITVSNTSETTKVATAYLSCTDYGQSMFVKVSCVTDAAIPETCSRSFIVHRARTV